MMIRKYHFIMVAAMLLYVRGETPDKTRIIRNYTLEYFMNGKTPRNAIADCESRNAWLVEIKDEEIGKAIEPWLTHDVFIGGKYDNNVWKWNDGSLMRYTKWTNGAPYSDPVKNCLVIQYKNYKWKNTECGETKGRYICQSDSSYPGGFQITAIKTSATFAEAKTYCSNNGSRLVEIKTSALDSFINNILNGDSASYWTSGQYSGGSWKWGDGNSISNSYTNWASPEPIGTNNVCLMKAQSIWKSVKCSEKNGYICQKNACEDEVCSNRGNCSIFNQRYKCSCIAGYFGTKCEKNIIAISTAEKSYNIQKGQTIKITFEIVSYDGNVVVKDIYDNRVIKVTSGITSSSLTDSLDCLLGPFNVATSSIDYVFEATSENSESTRLTLNIHVKDHCDSNPCKNGASCNYLISTPYFTCTCLPAYEGETCERFFVENSLCKYHINHEQLIGFEEANLTCHDLGGSLAMMKTSTIQDFVGTQIVKHYREYNPPVRAFWIGGITRSNSWYWLDDTPISLTGEYAQLWHSPKHKANQSYVILSSYGKTRLSMKWFLKNKDYKIGFVCEVPKTDLCASLTCSNNGSCIAVGCQETCKCSLEYYGTHCERESIQIIPRKKKFKFVFGQSIDVTLDIESHHGLVKVDFSKDKNSIAIATQNHINDSVTFTIGPFLQVTSGTQYYFRASPQLYPEAFFRYTSISVIVREVKLCVSLLCMNGGLCKAVGSHESCLCTPGYYGTNCENDYLTITPESKNYTAVVGNYFTIMLDIQNYGSGLVKVDVFANSINSSSIITKNYINKSTAITIGPFTKNKATAKYYFRASPQMYPESYNRWTSVTVVVQETATTTLEFAQQTQSSTIAISFVSIYGLLSTIIIVILFVRNRKKIDGKTKTESTPSGAMYYTREEKIECPYSYDNDKSDNNISQTSSFDSFVSEEQPSTEQKNNEKEFRAYEDIN